jgi:hypothetical protein
VSEGLIRRGGCRCGRVRFEARGPERRVGACHCESCRRATGAPFAVYLDYPPETVTLQGEAAVWSSRPGVERAFCGRCGSPLSYRGEAAEPEISLHLGAFDAPEGLVPRHVTGEAEALAWARAALAPTLRGEIP